MKYSGAVSRGIKAPIIKQGDDIVSIVIEQLKNVVTYENVTLNDSDIICITEAIVAKAQGNYATLDQIAKDVNSKFGDDVVGLILPILSRNRFAHILKGIAKGCKKLIIQLSFPSDEVGNCLMDPNKIHELEDVPSVLSYDQFRKMFGVYKHPFTDIDYIELYKEISSCEIIFANNPKAILNYTKNVIVGSIHSREVIKKILIKNGCQKVYGLDDILSSSVDGSGYHPVYGVLGSNVSTDDKVKLFPRDTFELVRKIQKEANEVFNVNLEVMVYGDGAFKDPVGGIWELADPVVSPGYTDGLNGCPYELKFKYLADNKLSNLNGEEAVSAMKNLIRNKKNDLEVNNRLGTTPRRITDILGSLADLTSGSGDKGTPIVLVQNYFSNYAD